MSMNEKYENTAVELKHIVEAKAVMEQQFTEDNNSLRKELQKTSLQLDKLLESASSLEDRNKNLQDDIDQMEKHKVSVEAQLASETEAGSVWRRSLKEKEESINVLVNNQT